MISLAPISPEILSRMLPDMIGAYANDLFHSKSYENYEEALSVATEEINGYFHEGRLIPGQLIYTINLLGIDPPIGVIWISEKSAQDPTKAFLCYIAIDPEHRGKGHAKRALTMAEKRLFKRGIPKLGLNVFVHNKVAMNMYLKMGYEVSYEVTLKKTGLINRYLMDKDLKKHYGR